MSARRGGHDFVVVGSGIAGSFAALHAARAGRVLLLTKTAMEESNSFYAQGGIAAALGGDDSPESHFRDTIEVGRGLCDENAVRILTEEGPTRIRELVALGVRFDRDDGDPQPEGPDPRGPRLALGREAAHSHARIVHAGGDTTGAEIQRGLHQALRDADVATREGHTVLRLLVEGGRCVGLLAEAGGEIVEYPASAVILAAGGAGRLFGNTTNPPTANGDGAALAYEAGAELADLEFFQFHPTALRKDGAPSFLISEAVRGEGAVLRNAAGERFLAERHPQAELAPRDVVAREIWAEMARTGADAVFLDLSALPADRMRGRFPQIYATCLRLGIDITRDLVPVAPAAHYMMGGVRTDLDGATSLPGLFACGEVACAGVHGANRLASNSLLESVVFSRRAARAAVAWAGAGVPAGGVAARAWPHRRNPGRSLHLPAAPPPGDWVRTGPEIGPFGPTPTGPAGAGGIGAVPAGT
ncbi:MAG TPA: L-aspartate oxidase, partial [Candidatus Dormibacteraeota bacterium]|nr:L-aspartate oxidase [Candidatus Dormibacteraeota bacterium]